MSSSAELPPLSPSDLAELGAASVLRVAGRVLDHDGQRLVLADAWTTIAVLGSMPLGAGDLAVIEGAWDGTALRNAHLIERYPYAAPPAFGEFHRFALGGVGARLRARAQAARFVREYFGEHGFLEVETPFRVPAPGVDLHLDALAAGHEFLITSPELAMKRLLVGGLPRIFQFARANRRDELGRLHEPEFTLLEWYRAFRGVESMLEDSEALVAGVAGVLGGGFLRTPEGREVATRRPFLRLTVREAFRAFADVEDAAALAAADEDRYFRLFVEYVEPALAELHEPVFLCDYPATQASLARRKPDDPNLAERFELYAGGIELCNGFGELTDPVEQARRFQAEDARRCAEGRTRYPIDRRFLAALEEGMPPSAGNALGFDRLLMLATGAPNVAAVIAFPAENR